MRPLTRHAQALLAALLAVPGLDSGRPWWPREVLPPLPWPGRAHYRSGRTWMLWALERRGLVARTADGRYCLTTAAARLATHPERK